MKFLKLIIVFIFSIFIFCQKQPTQTKLDDTNNVSSTDILFRIQIPPEIQTYVHSSFAFVTASFNNFNTSCISIILPP